MTNPRKPPRIAAAAALVACMVTAFAALGGVGQAQNAISAGQSQYGKKVTICHKGKTITVSKKALPAHLRHGDTVALCSSAKAKKAKAAKAKAAEHKAAKAKAAKIKAAKAKAAKTQHDQAVPKSSVDPPTTTCWSVPSAFMTRMSPGSPAAYAIWCPSGLQSGTWSLNTGSNVSCTAPVPSAFMT